MLKRASPAPTDPLPPSKKKKTESVAPPKKPPAQLEKWATKRQELSLTGLSDFADPDTLCCLLCKRKFPSLPDLQKHEALSQLHKSNLSNASLRKSVLDKIHATGGYRDRAKERRKQFNQPSRPEIPHPNPWIAAQQAVAKPPSPEPEPRQGKGAKLLAAMGWTEGTGLGVAGAGIVEPVKAGRYDEGVGLGAGGIKVVGEDIAGKDDDGSYRAYVRKVKNVARTRYENAQKEDDTEDM
jgi:RNA-binding protein 5/10